jgi:hypothetical protein
MATTFGLRGANSASLQQTGGNEVVANVALIATQPAGQLLTFLSTTFANDAAAETAFRNAGGEIVIRATAGTDPVAATFAWTAAAAVPALTIASAAADNVFELKIRVEHSITR